VQSESQSFLAMWRGGRDTIFERPCKLKLLALEASRLTPTSFPTQLKARVVYHLGLGISDNWTNTWWRTPNKSKYQVKRHHPLGYVSRVAY